MRKIPQEFAEKTLFSEPRFNRVKYCGAGRFLFYNYISSHNDASDDIVDEANLGFALMTALAVTQPGLKGYLLLSQAPPSLAL